MPSGQMNEVIQYLCCTLPLPEEHDLTDGQLLKCFVSRRDAAALEALVLRYSPMVWGVCHRTLRNEHDTEDAFQATFLVLVRKAASISPRSKVGNWLYGVARQTAIKARAIRAKRQVREKPVTEMPEPTVKERDLWSDLQPLLDHEVSLLPEKYRTVIMLCELEGKTKKEAARQLGLPEGTVASRVARARTMLAKRLTWHGLAVTSGALGALFSQKAESAVAPTSVMTSTIKAVTLIATEQTAATVTISGTVNALAEGVIKTMLLNKFMKVATVLFVVAMICLSGGLYTHQAARAQQRRVVEQEAADGPVTAIKVNEEQRPEVRVRHPKQIEAVPKEHFTGQLGPKQGDSIAVMFAVDERSFLRYQRLLSQHLVKGPGSPLYLGLSDEEGFPHLGTLKSFDDKIDSGTGTVQVQGSLPNPDRLFLPGMFVRVCMPIGSPQKVLVAPEEAVLSDQGKRYLLVVTDKDIVERRAVTLGATEGNMRIIEKGVSTEDWIVIAGLNKIMPGTHVKRRIVEDVPQVEDWATKAFEKTVWDIENHTGEKQLKHIFNMTNLSSMPLRVTEVRIPAGSVTCSFTTANLKPKESGYITVMIDPKHLPVTKDVKIYVTIEHEELGQTSIVTLTVRAKATDN
jgi:RNA polymerase sigma factor (sigma-70 family)